MILGACRTDCQEGWVKLFNGKDLEGWDTYLRSVDMSGYEIDPTYPYQPPIGLNNDPLDVFTVQDGVIRISGEVWGAITSKEEYSNYHLRFETKWGEKKWAPKDSSLRDGGLLFHCTEGFDYAFACWMRSMEMQIQEGEIGDFYNVGGGDAEFKLRKTVTREGENANQYDPFAKLKRQPGRVYRSGDFESPPGEWTRSELIARHADAVFIVNGFVVNRLFNMYRPDLQQPVTTGKIQFQSEGAEHYLRNIEIRPLTFSRHTPRLVPQDSVLFLSHGQRGEITVLNEGQEVELIAAELMGRDIENFQVTLPELPYVLKPGEKLQLPVSLKAGAPAGQEVKFRLETVSGPVPGFEVVLRINDRM